MEMLLNGMFTIRWMDKIHKRYIVQHAEKPLYKMMPDSLVIRVSLIKMNLIYL
jgi:hypothetical protein